MTEKIALARRMRALAGRETTDVNTTRGIAIVTRMRLARANQHVHTQQLRRYPEKDTQTGAGLTGGFDQKGQGPPGGCENGRKTIPTCVDRG